MWTVYKDSDNITTNYLISVRGRVFACAYVQ